MRLLKRVSAILLTAACTACSHDARLTIKSHLVGPLTTGMLTITVKDGTRSWTWTGRDFATGTEDGVPATPAMHTGTSGDALVTFEVRNGEDVLSSGALTLPLQDDWEWTLDFAARTTDPRMNCLGCQGAEAFPIAEPFRTAPRDSLWLVWGGNSLSNPVLY
jgi:hypothetical protein